MEGQRKELRELERHGGQGHSEEWMMQMRNKIAKVQKNIATDKSKKQKMELKGRSIMKELERRNFFMKKVVQARSKSNVLPSSSKRLKSNLNETVIDCGMVRKVSSKEKDAIRD